MVVIVGAGLAGLSAARFLKRPYRIFEKENEPGGLSRSIEKDGFIFDYAGHWFHARQDWVKEFLAESLGDNWSLHRRDARVFSHGALIPYPFQMNLGALPNEVALECMMGLIEAKYQMPRRPIRTFEDYILRSMGKGIARHFMIPYNRKLWNMHPRSMTTDWMGRFVPEPDVEHALRSILDPSSPVEAGYNAGFAYPKEGGIGAVPRALAAQVQGIECGTEVRRIEAGKRRATLADGHTVDYQAMISSMPLKELVRITADAPPSVKAAGRLLNWSALVVLNVGVTDVRLPLHWCYVAEDPPAFFRVGCYSNACPTLVPTRGDGTGSLYIEYSYPKRIPEDTPEIDAEAAVEWLKGTGMLGPSAKICTAVRLHIDYAYVVYDKNRKAAVATIKRYMRRHGIHTIGRYGSWEYSSMEDAMEQGRATAELLNSQ